MLNKIFPEQADNTYRGHPIAKWVFIVLVVITIARSLVHMFLPDGGAQSIATIDLDNFTPGGSSTVITMFALWGLSQLIVGLLYAVVLWRYQAFIPLMYVTLLFEYTMRLAAPLYTPGIATVGVPPGSVGNYILVSLAGVMLILSLMNRQPDATG